LGKAPFFKSLLVLAVATDLAQDSQARCCAERIATVCHAALRARCMRPWGIARDSGFYTNAINDLAVVGLFQKGPRQAAPPALSLLDGEWEAY
jgi:hypothetical protein